MIAPTDGDDFCDVCDEELLDDDDIEHGRHWECEPWYVD